MDGRPPQHSSRQNVQSSNYDKNHTPQSLLERDGDEHERRR